MLFKLGSYTKCVTGSELFTFIMLRFLMRKFVVSLLVLLLFVNSLNVFAKKTNSYNPTVVISIDGFAHHYLELYKPPNLLKLARNGVVSDGLIPVFPTKTFPNHLSIVTGNYPVNHGLVHNRFYNRELNQTYKLGIGKLNSKWVTSPTLWSIAEQNDIKTGIYFWPESEVATDKNRPTYSFPYKHNTPNITRLDQIVDWLKLPVEERPEILLGYVSTIDSVGHDFGTRSVELAESIKDFDKLLGHFLSRVDKELSFDVNIIIVSDHGMVDISQDQFSYFHLFDGIDTVQVINGQTQLYVYLNSGDDEDETLLKIHQNIRAKERKYIKLHKFDSFPKHWHFDRKTPVMPNLVVEVLPPYTFGNQRETGKATHGYSPELSSDLNAIFIATGPSFKTQQKIRSFENIHILPMILELYNIEISHKINGKKDVLYPILQ